MTTNATIDFHKKKKNSKSLWCFIQICLKDFWRTTWTMSSFWQPTTRVTNLIAQVENVCLVHLWLGGDYLWLTIQMFRIDYCVCHAWQRQTSRRWCGSVVRDTLGTAIKRRLIAWFPRTQIIRVSENGESWDNTRDGWLFGDRWHCSWGDDLNCSSVKSILERVAVIADGDGPACGYRLVDCDGQDPHLSSCAGEGDKTLMDLPQMPRRRLLTTITNWSNLIA